MSTYVESTEKYSTAKKSYKATAELTDLIDEFLRYPSKLEALQDKIRAGGMTQEQVDKEWDDLKHEKDNLDRIKVDVLNRHIFPAMANLTVLLEKMHDNPHIREIFKDDLKSLFFAQSVNNEDKTYIFYRFLHACVAKPKTSEQQTKDTKTVPTSTASDPRFILGELMQRAVYAMIEGIEPHEFKDLIFLRDMLLNDIRRSIQWTQLFAGQWHGHLKFRGKRRPALF
jgi:hypothetical protein